MQSLYLTSDGIYLYIYLLISSVKRILAIKFRRSEKLTCIRGIINVLYYSHLHEPFKAYRSRDSPTL